MAQSRPSPNASRILTWLDGYLKALIAISVFGGQITFTVVVSSIPPPTADGPFTAETVRLFVALSWLFFMVELGIAALVKILLMDEDLKKAAGTHLEKGTTVFTWVYGGGTFLLNGLPLVAFLFLALAVVAYVPVVGWIGVALISLFAVAVVGFWAVLDG